MAVACLVKVLHAWEKEGFIMNWSKTFCLKHARTRERVCLSGRVGLDPESNEQEEREFQLSYLFLAEPGFPNPFFF